MSHPGDAYFATQVLTAPPQKLHGMLLEGALRHGRRAAALFREGHDAAAGEALLRSQEIMTELLASLKPEAAPAVVRQVAGVYVFVHRSLATAHFRRDLQALDEALGVLEVECETWRQLCSQMEGAAPAPPAPALKPHVPRPAFLDSPGAASRPSMSFEA
jgi:flagellar secretion chaperone FliS